MRRQESLPESTEQWSYVPNSEGEGLPSTPLEHGAFALCAG